MTRKIARALFELPGVGSKGEMIVRLVRTFLSHFPREGLAQFEASFGLSGRRVNRGVSRA